MFASASRIVSPEARHRSRRLGGIAALLGASWLAIASMTGVAAQESATPTAIQPGVLDTEPATLDCDPTDDATPAAGDAVTAAEIYEIVSEESEARYLVEEELAGVGATTAIGRTNAFIGSILFDEEGMPLPCSQFFVDLRTLTSDEPRRDNYLYNNTLETQTYPLASFVLTGVEGLEGALEEGKETTLTLLGDLTIHGVTRAVAWQATVTLDGDQLTGSATLPFEMPDFDIEPPRVGAVVSLDETVTLEIDVTAQRVA